MLIGFIIPYGVPVYNSPSANLVRFYINSSNTLEIYRVDVEVVHGSINDIPCIYSFNSLTHNWYAFE